MRMLGVNHVSSSCARENVASLSVGRETGGLRSCCPIATLRKGSEDNREQADISFEAHEFRYVEWVANIAQEEQEIEQQYH